MANATQPAGRSHHRIRLRTYLDYRLGRNQPWWRQTYNVLAALLSHRLNPFVTVWFMVYGAVTVASEALHMDLSRLPAPARVVVNLAYLIGCYKLVSPLLP